MANRPAEILSWAVENFGEIAADDTERARRFLEEAIELGQAMGLPIGDVRSIALRVYSRPAGVIPQEIGQCQITLECLAQVMSVSADFEADEEFHRVKSIPKSEWERRHAAKVALGIAGSRNNA
jgi:hypothetical protein